jgi:LmbE family N-acetylglucosaminyl deacetylase
MKRTLTVLLPRGLVASALLLVSMTAWGGAASGTAGQLRIICFGAHPDDCEIQASGTAMMWAAKGHKVKFVSTTNGDIGHWREAGAPLARRRTAEVQEAARILGITTEVLDIHDGELMVTLENRRWITRLIREWQADIVMGPRPNDYHPDHRYTGVLVQDAAYMVTVPQFCPDVPHLQKNPVFLYYPDRFQKPNPFQADIVVDITPVMDKKLDALGVLVSQFYEGGANGSAGLMPSDPEKQKARHSRCAMVSTAAVPAWRSAFASRLGNGTRLTGCRRSSMLRPSRSASTASNRTRRS